MKILDMGSLTDVTINAMRRIALELRPSILDDLGLSEAIEWQAQQFQTRRGIVCRCHCSLENVDFDPEQATAIFRIFQEALTNVLAHSGATAVEVVARAEHGDFVLTVSDNEEESRRIRNQAGYLSASSGCASGLTLSEESSRSTVSKEEEL